VTEFLTSERIGLGEESAADERVADSFYRVGGHCHGKPSGRYSGRVRIEHDRPLLSLREDHRDRL
jgi:hypothetical protein